MMVEIEHIPGETPVDPTDIIKPPEDNLTRAELVKRETFAIRPATRKYMTGEVSLRTAPFTATWMIRVHAEMFHTVYYSAGQTRKHDVNIGIPWHEVDVQISEFAKDIEVWTNGDMPLVEQCALLHHRAVQIHPFRNGNGRWSRLLGNIWLRRHKQPVIKWPEVTIGDESEIRAEYIEAIQLADGGDYQPLFNMHRRYWAGS